MNTRRSQIKAEVSALYEAGAKLCTAFQDKKETNFHYEYQSWYTKALRVVSVLASDRLAEFRGYYEIDPKRKSLGYATYVIQDYMKDVVPNKLHHPDFDSRAQALLCFFNQLTILRAIAERIDSALDNIEGELYAGFQDDEIAMARQLSKVSLRAAGALAGVVVEGHLQRVVDSHNIKVTKKNPTIADLNELLKSAEVIDTAAWRKISFLADIRNLCSHKKSVEPTEDRVEELIQGADWLVKNVV